MTAIGKEEEEEEEERKRGSTIRDSRRLWTSVRGTATELETDNNVSDDVGERNRRKR